MFFFNKSVPANELEIENSGLSGNKNSKHYDVDSILDEILGMDPLAISLEDDDVQNILNQKNYSFEIILENDSNVFDDTSSPQQSHSTISQFDFFWKYKNFGKYEFNLLVSSENTNYSEELLQEGEQFFFTRFEYLYSIYDSSDIGFNLDYSRYRYLNPSSSSSIEPIQVENSNQITISSFWDLYLEGRWKTNVKATLSRYNTIESDFDYNETVINFKATKIYNLNSELNTSFEFSQNQFDNRSVQDINGNYINNSTLKTKLDRFNIENKHQFSKISSWILQSEVELASMKDNGPGYLNYNKVDIRESVNYVSDTWETFLMMRLNYKNYLERIRTTSLIELSTGLEKQFNEWLSTKININHTESYSNFTSDIFKSKSYQIGITVDF